MWEWMQRTVQLDVSRTRGERTFAKECQKVASWGKEILDLTLKNARSICWIRGVQ